MAHFAEIDDNNVVLRVLVVPDEWEWRGEEYLSKDHKLGGRWLQCSYTGKIRGVFPGIGYLYLADFDRFVEPSPYASWTLDTESFNWVPPVPEPQVEENQFTVWDEENSKWQIITTAKIEVLG